MFSPVDFLAQIANFLLLMALLTRIMYKPVSAALKKRELELEHTREEQRRLLAEAAHDRQKARKALQEVSSRARQIMKQAEREARSYGNQESLQARERALRIVQHAEERALQVEQQAVRHLESRLSDIVLAAAKQVLAREVDRQDHQVLLDEFESQFTSRGGRQ